MEVVKSQNLRVLKYILVIFLGSVLLTISSNKIPFYPVPMTMQTFVVLFLGMSFGYKIGLATVGLLDRELLDCQFFQILLKKVLVLFTLLVQPWDI